MHSVHNWQTHFSKCQNILCSNSIIDLLENSFNNLIISKNTKSAFFDGYKSDYPNIVTIHNKDTLIACAATTIRDIQYQTFPIKAMSVGSVAVEKSYQGKGLGKLLMKGIENLAKKQDVDLIYLVGIKGFYQRIGYQTFMNRSKIILRIHEVPVEDEICVIPLRNEFKKSVMNCYRNLSTQFNYTAIRNQSDWNWLFETACKSHYFFDPHIVLDEYSNFRGYLTYDPIDYKWIREIGYEFKNEEDIYYFLSGLRKFGEAKNIEEIEIMTPKNSPLYSYCKQNTNFVFTEINNIDGGIMVKVLNNKISNLVSKIKANKDSFLFQGDNL